MKRMAALLATAAAISGTLPATAGAVETGGGKCSPVHILKLPFPFC